MLCFLEELGFSTVGVVRSRLTSCSSQGGVGQCHRHSKSFMIVERDLVIPLFQLALSIC